MKNLLFIFGISLIALFFSCSTEQEETVTDEVLGSVSEVIFTASDFDYMETLSTRTDFVINDSGAGFQWSTKDTIGIFPDAGSQVYFPMENGAGTNSAKFTGGGWALKGSSTYYAYYPFCRRYSLSDEIINKIPVTFERQSQEGNACTSALGAFDYMAASGSSPVSGALNFRFEHLGALAQISVTVPSASAFTQLELIPSNLEFISQGFYDLKAGVPAIVGLETSNKLTLDLLNVSTSSDGETLTFYMMLPPTDLKVENLTVMLNAAGGNYCRGTLEFNKQLKAGKAYQMNFSSTEMIQMLTNQNLIAAAEASTGRSFERTADGNVSLNNDTNQEIVNEVTELNLSNLGDPKVCEEIGLFMNLKTLDCSYNGIEVLDMTKNILLESLTVAEEYSYTLEDGIFAGIIKDIKNYGSLKDLNVTTNVALKYLNCTGNPITQLNLINNVALNNLYCSYCTLDNLDLSNNTELLSLSCQANNIYELDLSYNSKIISLNCSYNHISSLDLSEHSSLKQISCRYNGMTYLNVTNDENLISLDAWINKLTHLNVSTNPSLKTLICSQNNLSSLDLTQNKELQALYSGGNDYTSLDVSQNTELEILYVDFSKLTNIDLTSNTKLVHLYCNDSQLAYLDVTRNQNLMTLICRNNQLKSLDLSNNKDLNSFQCFGNNLIELDISQNEALEPCKIYVGGQKDSNGIPLNMDLFVNPVQYQQNLASSYDDPKGGAYRDSDNDWKATNCYHSNDDVTIRLKSDIVD